MASQPKLTWNSNYRLGITISRRTFCSVGTGPVLGTRLFSVVSSPDQPKNAHAVGRRLDSRRGGAAADPGATAETKRLLTQVS